MTKTQDQLFFFYYNKNYQLRITDLHQGIVWGTQTPETALDERLINRFDYDGDYGTVLNRLLMQAALDYPLTVHGTGRADPSLHPHPGYGTLHCAGDRQPSATGRTREYLQSDDRGAPADRSSKDYF